MKIDIKVNTPQFMSKIVHIISNTNEIYVKINGKIKLKINNGTIIKKTDCGILEIHNINEYMNAHQKGLI